MFTTPGGRSACWQISAEGQRGQRGRLRRLQYHRVAAGQRGCDLPGEHEQREVPRDDLAGDAERPRVWPEACIRELVRPARVVEEVRRAQRDVDVAGLPDRLAVVERLEDGEFAGPLLNDPGDPEEVFGPVGRPHRSPGRGVCGAGGGDCAVDVLRSRLGDVREHLLGCRADRLERMSVEAVDELASDEQAIRRLNVDDRPRLGRRRILKHSAQPRAAPRHGTLLSHDQSKVK
jgi:ParB family chromosome partitioning protein